MLKLNSYCFMRDEMVDFPKFGHIIIIDHCLTKANSQNLHRVFHYMLHGNFST